MSLLHKRNDETHQQFYVYNRYSYTFGLSSQYHYKHRLIRNLLICLINNYMKMKSTIFFISLAILLSGCASIKPISGVKGDSTKDINKAVKAVGKSYEEIQDNQKERQIQTSILADGVQYSLTSITNAPVPIQVETAKKLNSRIISLQGSPFINSQNTIRNIVDNLNSEIAKERQKGLSELNKRDKTIQKLQDERSELKAKYNEELENIATKAQTLAESNDEKQAAINEMNKWFGLGAVYHGLKRFFFSSLTFIIVFVIIFLFLRILAAGNPIAGALFAVFNFIGSAIVHTIRALTPKAFEISGFHHQNVTHRYKGTLGKIVKIFDEFKIKQEANPEYKYSLGEILDTFRATFSEHDKELIKEIQDDSRRF